MPLNVSVFEEICLLIDPVEMADFLSVVPNYAIIDASAPLNEKNPPRIQFLQAYQQYVDQLKGGVLWDPKEAFHGKMVVDPKIVQFNPVKDGRWLIDFLQPPIYLRHVTGVVDKDKNFKLFVFGPNKLFLGVAFRYPRIYEGQDRVSRKTVGSQEFLAFRDMARWVRNHTVMLHYKNSPLGIRVSPASLRWVKNHFQLKPYFDAGDIG
jgi:hypothetical protein